MAFNFKKKSKYRNWLKGGLGIAYLKGGLQAYCNEIAKRQHKQLLDTIKQRYKLTDVRCGNCCIDTLRPDHVQNEFKSCPLGQEHCNCQSPKGKISCKNNVCGVIYDYIITHHASVPPTPNWKNTDLSHWCNSPWEIAKCFISQNGYAETKTAQDTDCAALLSVLVNNTACRTGPKLADICSKLCNETNKLLQSTSLELDDSDVNKYLDGGITVLQNVPGLRARRKSKRFLEKLVTLRCGRYYITKDNELAVHLDSCESIRRGFSRIQNEVCQGVLTRVDHVKTFKLNQTSRCEITEAKQGLQGDWCQNSQLDELLRVIQNKYTEVKGKVPTMEKGLEERIGQGAEQRGFEIMLQSSTERARSFKHIKDIKDTAETMPSTSVQKAAAIKMFIVPASCFPRYEYALQNVIDTINRYKNVFGTSDNGGPVSSDIGVYLCKENSENAFPCHISDIVLQQGETESFPEIEYSNLSDCFKAKEKSRVSVFIGSSKEEDLLSHKGIRSDFTFILTRSKRDSSKLKSNRSTENVLVVRKETVGKKVEECLEKSIFDALRPVCEGLFKNIENTRLKRRHKHVGDNTCYATPSCKDTYRQSHNRRNGTHSKQQDSYKRKTMCSKFETPDNKEKILKKDQSRSDGKCLPLKQTAFRCNNPENMEVNEISQPIPEYTTDENMKQSVAFTESAKENGRPVSAMNPRSRRNQVQRQQQLSNVLRRSGEVLHTLSKQTSECLLEELIGVFNMSEASLKELPNISQHRDEVDLDSLSKSLFSKFPTVRGVGFRMQNLQVDVENSKDIDTPKKRAEFHKTLCQHKVDKYDIVPLSMKKYLTSGDEICVDGKGGSFGCFAKIKTEAKDTLCGLLSKHVATPHRRSEIKAKEDGRFKSVGYVLQDTVTEDGLDIAAAELSIPLERCETRFKSARGRPLETGRNKSRERLRGHKVHMWGAVSEPGIGIITIPDYRCKDMDYTLIQVEDIVDGEQKIEKRFAQPGDSGAVACADDPGQKYVHPISMNIGCMNYTEVCEDNKNEVKMKPGKYMTVPLQCGIQQLTERTKRNFVLC